MKRIICFLKYFGTLNYYKGVDKLTLWDWLYKYRIGISTTWRLVKLIHSKTQAMNKTAIIDGIEYDLVPKTPEVNRPVKPSPKEWLLDYLSKGFDKVELGKGRMVYYRNGQWIFNLNLKNKILWCYFYEVWEVFYKEYAMDYDQVQHLMKEVVLEPLNCRGFTPRMR